MAKELTEFFNIDPIGFLELYYEIVSHIELTFNSLWENESNPDLQGLLSKYNQFGTGYKWELANELVTKFNQQYASENWDETDWFETVGLFVNEEIKELKSLFADEETD